MPETDIVDRAATEGRMYDVLVTQARIDAIIAGAEAYCRLEGNTYPANVGLLVSPPAPVAARMAHCRVDRVSLNDAWGRPIVYSISEGTLAVRSAGGDAKFYTPDDIGLPTSADPHVESFDLWKYCSGG